MASTTTDPHRAEALPIWQRLFFAIPVLGWMAHDILYRGRDNIPYAAVTLATFWILAIAQFGLPALLIPMLALVPACMVMLVWLTRG
ncbi:MAG: hypothetical protein JJU40_01345 [Rhodobacteraceae bacterium]|nr:hypothetical protein [Paracoccaceae bacterium]